MATKISDKQWEQLLGVIASGLSERDACNVVEIHRSSLYNRKKEDLDFVDRVKKSESAFKMKHVRNIADASTKTWQASAWLLERKFPEEYGDRGRLDITSGGKPIAPPSWFGKTLVIEAEDVDDLTKKLPPDNGGGNGSPPTEGS